MDRQADPRRLNSAMRVGSRMCQARTQDLSSVPQPSKSTRHCRPFPQQSEHSRYSIWPSRLDCPQSGKKVGFNVLILPREHGRLTASTVQFQLYCHRINNAFNCEMPTEVRGQKCGQKYDGGWQRQCSSWPREKMQYEIKPRFVNIIKGWRLGWTERWPAFLRRVRATVDNHKHNGRGTGQKYYPQ